MPAFDFIGAAYTAWSRNVAAQECVNLYPEASQDKKSVAALRGTPGLSLFCAIGAQPWRGGHVVQKASTLMYVVAGNKLYSLTTAGVATERGTLNTSVGRVAMSDNGTQIMITDGTNGYTYTIATTTLAEITDAQYPDAASVNLFLDGYTIVNVPDSGSFQISSAYDATAWAALDVKTAEGDPDNLVTLAKRNRQLFAIGDISIEVFYNSGNAVFPFDRVNGVIIDAGCVAKWSVAEVNSNLMWLAKDKGGTGFVIMLEGYTPRRVSTPALEDAIAGYEMSDAFAWSYHRSGHIFYVLTFPTNAETWVFDVSTNLWHKRETYGCNGRHAANGHVFFNGKHYVGDYRNGNVYELSETVYTDNTEQIERWRTSPYAYADNREIEFANFEVMFESGVGNSDCDDPQAMMQYSDDGGHTWSNERWKSIGEIGEYGQRAIWRRMGKATQRIFKVKVSDPVKVVMINASINGG